MCIWAGHCILNPGVQGDRLQARARSKLLLIGQQHVDGRRRRILRPTSGMLALAAQKASTEDVQELDLQEVQEGKACFLRVFLYTQSKQG